MTIIRRMNIPKTLLRSLTGKGGIKTYTLGDDEVTLQITTASDTSPFVYFDISIDVENEDSQ
jgi:hypothetical protein